jgi:hypothetical protein
MNLLTKSYIMFKVIVWAFIVLCSGAAISIIQISIKDREINEYGIIALGTNLLTVGIGIYILLTH